LTRAVYEFLGTSRRFYNNDKKNFDFPAAVNYISVTAKALWAFTGLQRLFCFLGALSITIH